MEKLLKSALIFTLFLIIVSCNDIINTDPNIQKDLVYKKLTPEDSLNFLVPQKLDLGSIKVGSAINGFVSIANNSKDKTIIIYKIEQQNQSGLFAVTYKNALPIKLIPGGDVILSEEIKVRFIADAFTLGFYYDTLFINGSRKLYVPMVAKIRY